MTSELKPCPFCGGEAVPSNEWGRAGIKCSQCGVSYRPNSFDSNKYFEESVAVWNTRTPDEQEPVAYDDYDAGYLNDWGGGNVEWWQNYIRAEIGRANEFWRSQVTHPSEADELLRSAKERLTCIEAHIQNTEYGNALDEAKCGLADIDAYLSTKEPDKESK